MITRTVLVGNFVV